MKVAHIHVSDTKNKGDVAIVLAVQNLIKRTLPEAEVIDIPIEELKNEYSDWINIINSANLVVLGGGGVYCRYFLPFSEKIVNAIIPPLVIMGVGHGNELGADPLSNIELNSILNLHEKSALSSVRDPLTFDMLISNGHSKVVHLLSDPAIHLDEEPFELDYSKTSVGLNINYSGWLDFGKHQSNIISSYRYCIDRLKEDYGANIFFTVHHPGEYNVYPKIGRKLEIVDLDPARQKYFYSKMNLVIGMMLHSSILTFGAGTPLLNIAYDVKNMAFAKYIGHDELVIHPDDLSPEYLWLKAKTVLDNYYFYRRRFRKKKRQFAMEMESFLSEIKQLV